MSLGLERKGRANSELGGKRGSISVEEEERLMRLEEERGGFLSLEEERKG